MSSAPWAGKIACKQTWWDVQRSSNRDKVFFFLRDSFNRRAFGRGGCDVIKHDENWRVARLKQQFRGFFLLLFNVYIVTYDKFDERVRARNWRVNKRDQLKTWLKWTDQIWVIAKRIFSIKASHDFSILRKNLKLDFWCNASWLKARKMSRKSAWKRFQVTKKKFYGRIMIYGSTRFGKPAPAFLYWSINLTLLKVCGKLKSRSINTEP